MITWLEQLYEKLWHKVGGKPWTEIVREEQKQSPLVYMLVFLGLGIMVGKVAGKYWRQVLIGFFFGILCGHFWW